MKIKIKKAAILFVVLCLALLSFKVITSTDLGLMLRLHNIAAENETLTFQQAFPFSWDVAYRDAGVYGTGSWLKEKYNLEFTVSELMRDDKNRLLFFKGGKLVRVVTYEIGYTDIDLKKGNDEIMPQTKFSVFWKDEKKNDLVLTQMGD